MNSCNPGYDAWKTSGPPEPTDEQERHGEMLDGLQERANEAASIALTRDNADGDLDITSSLSINVESEATWLLTFESRCVVRSPEDMIVYALEFAAAAKVFAEAINDY